ncbi:hypothetical protein V1525DRAFT_346707 [Lipomyces kononenkoae]|uniref:Uncharacterized protein n=1 Tax=Lipomyces kononenkoae TaxID=34357 RepID=A0ACC3SXS1_LIPKO
MAEFKSFLNVRIIRDSAKGKLWLCRDQFIAKTISCYHLEYLQPAPTSLSPAELTKYDGEARPDQIIGYQSRVGSIQYIASTARPDVAFTASKLTEFLTNPSPAHQAEAHRALAYLDSTRYVAIEYSRPLPPPQTLVFKSASDASLADDPEDWVPWKPQMILILKAKAFFRFLEGSPAKEGKSSEEQQKEEREEMKASATTLGSLSIKVQASDPWREIPRRKKYGIVCLSYTTRVQLV